MFAQVHMYISYMEKIHVVRYIIHVHYTTVALGIVETHALSNLIVNLDLAVPVHIRIATSLRIYTLLL